VIEGGGYVGARTRQSSTIYMYVVFTMLFLQKSKIITKYTVIFGFSQPYSYLMTMNSTKHRYNSVWKGLWLVLSGTTGSELVQTL